MPDLPDLTVAAGLWRALPPLSASKAAAAAAVCDERTAAASLDWTHPAAAGAGLRNLGNTCFLNAILQLLTHTPPLAAIALTQAHSRSCRLADCAQCLLENRIQSNLQASAPQAPAEILDCMRRTASLRALARGRQEDAHEFLRLVVEALQHAGLRALGVEAFGPGAQAGPHRPRTVVERVFGATLLSRVTCGGCGACSDTRDTFEDLSLELVKGVDSVPAALRHYTKAESLDGDDKYRCGACGHLCPAQKKMSIDCAPNVLVLHLKRFKTGGWGKVTAPVAFSERLSLEAFMAEQEAPQAAPVYSLYAVVVHSGFSVGSGHYYAYVRDAAGRWYECDDSAVRPVPVAQVLRAEAYVLAYLREPRTELRVSTPGASAPPAQAVQPLRRQPLAEACHAAVAALRCDQAQPGTPGAAALALAQQGIAQLARTPWEEERVRDMRAAKRQRRLAGHPAATPAELLRDWTAMHKAAADGSLRHAEPGLLPFVLGGAAAVLREHGAHATEPEGSSGAESPAKTELKR